MTGPRGVTVTGPRGLMGTGPSDLMGTGLGLELYHMVTGPWRSACGGLGHSISFHSHFVHLSGQTGAQTRDVLVVGTIGKEGKRNSEISSEEAESPRAVALVCLQ